VVTEQLLYQQELQQKIEEETRKPIVRAMSRVFVPILVCRNISNLCRYFAPAPLLPLSIARNSAQWFLIVSLAFFLVELMLLALN